MGVPELVLLLVPKPPKPLVEFVLLPKALPLVPLPKPPNAMMLGSDDYYSGVLGWERAASGRVRHVRMVDVEWYN